ncbi:MAG TPA: VOC family protein [Arenicellales bacterium]|nr:VOC family protein [Arenicellales bacterium]
MQMHTYLNFDGNCREAMEFYRDHLGGEITAMMTWGEAPFADEVPPESRDRIMHACFQLGGHMLMGTDATSQHPYRGITGSSVVLEAPDAETAERLFQSLSDGGRVDMPMDETFWAHRFGMLVDRFGVPWMINCGKEESR